MTLCVCNVKQQYLRLYGLVEFREVIDHRLNLDSPTFTFTVQNLLFEALYLRSVAYSGSEASHGGAQMVRMCKHPVRIGENG
jgi:hypothetical protein